MYGLIRCFLNNGKKHQETFGYIPSVRANCVAQGCVAHGIPDPHHGLDELLGDKAEY